MYFDLFVEETQHMDMGLSDRDSSIDATSTTPPGVDWSSTSGMAYSSVSCWSSVATWRCDA